MGEEYDVSSGKCHVSEKNMKEISYLSMIINAKKAWNSIHETGKEDILLHSQHYGKH